MKIYLDFFSGSHGHFLEYVINTWLFKGPRVSSIFNDLGASHQIRRDVEYTMHRVICADHYSEFNKSCMIPEKVVKISIDNDWANYVYQINVLARAGDIPLEKKLKLTPEAVRNDPCKFRNEWYSKFNSTDGYNRPGNWRWHEIPSFTFPMESLFDLVDFYNELYRLANFLETTFVPDQNLSKLLEDFLNRNQGWQYYKICKQLVHDTFTGNNVNFSSNEVSQALINTLLSKSIGIFDGHLFTNNTYPTNTGQIWYLIDHHLKTFDLRF